MAASKRPKAAEQPKRRPGRPKGARGQVAEEGRTERLFVSVTPAQREKLEDDLLDLKKKKLRPANYPLSQYLYDLLFPSTT